MDIASAKRHMMFDYTVNKYGAAYCAAVSTFQIRKAKSAIKDARKIDMNLVDAQQARRALDRVVGYSISPVLWAKIKRGLSAGRVQSVALRIICDRENEIDAFIPEEYWTLDAVLDVEGEKKPVTAKFYGDVNGKIDIKNKEQMEDIKKKLEGCEYSVDSIKRGEKIKKSPLPFTTSTLQQEASKTLNFATAKTMRIAQQLYEGVDIAGKGTIGGITYLRTDSTRVAEEAQAASKEYIEANYGAEYLMKDDLKKKEDKKAHGWGVRIIKEVVQKAGGYLNYTIDVGIIICADVFLPFIGNF